MTTVAKSKSKDPNQKVKLIAACVVLFLAVSWIVYSQFIYTGRPAPATGARAEQIQQENEQIKQELEQQQLEQNHGRKPKPPSGA